MTMTLFDFEEDVQDLTETKIQEMFVLLQQDFKKTNNPFRKSIKYLPEKLKLYLQYFEDKGWIKIEMGTSVQIIDEYVDWHTPEEVVDTYQEQMETLLLSPNICWYTDVLQLRNFHGPIRFRSNEDRERWYELKKEITKQASIQLGLNHFLNVPSSRGPKMSSLSSWAKKHVLPIIAEHVISISDYDEMENFFREHSFFFGRRDWDWGKSTFPLAPYPVFKSFSPTEFKIACFCEAQDQKTVALILEYMGYASGGGIHKDRKVIFPKGWSMEKYNDSLTADDIDLIYSDIERLDRLHNGRVLNGRSI